MAGMEGEATPLMRHDCLMCAHTGVNVIHVPRFPVFAKDEITVGRIGPRGISPGVGRVKRTPVGDISLPDQGPG